MEADIAIVGAGIVGCVIAREVIARAPGTSLVMFDRDAVGGGASRRSAGLHLPRGSTDRVRRMSEYSQDYYARLKAGSPTLPIHERGMSVVAAAGSAPKLAEVYLESARLTPTDEVPGIRLPDQMQAWTGVGCQYADVQALTQALAAQLRGRIGLREGVRVDGIDARRDGVALRLSTGETFVAHQVVLAPGPWLAATAWRELLAPLGNRVKKVVALHVEQTPADDDQVVVFQDEDAFLLPLGQRGHWLYSYTCTEWDVDPDTVDGGLLARDLDEAREHLRGYAPAMAERCTSGRVFCDAYSRTGDPRVRPLDSDGRIVFAGAANGSGYRLAPAMASEAADLLHLVRSHA
ncbi:FAD-binding oxidoreductase [Actinophytocola sp.]|uniref:NAD(P)/FAD-dependent oxidoreductase n=1 Tax=Actinophytocola sp. TaxID=1872138 RepID=UPI002ED1A1A0